MRFSLLLVPCFLSLSVVLGNFHWLFRSRFSVCKSVMVKVSLQIPFCPRKKLHCCYPFLRFCRGILWWLRLVRWGKLGGWDKGADGRCLAVSRVRGHATACLASRVKVRQLGQKLRWTRVSILWERGRLGLVVIGLGNENLILGPAGLVREMGFCELGR